MEISFWKHLLIGRNKDHLGIKVRTDRVMLVEISSRRAGHNENAVAALVVFGHAQMELGGNGVSSHRPSRRIDTNHIATRNHSDGRCIGHRIEDDQTLHEAVRGGLQSLGIFGQLFRRNMITNAIGSYHQLSLFLGHALFQQFDEHLRALAVTHQEKGATMVVMLHIILKGIVDILRRDLCQRVQHRGRLTIRLENHLSIVGRIKVVFAIKHLVEALIAVGFFPYFGHSDVGKP